MSKEGEVPTHAGLVEDEKERREALAKKRDPEEYVLIKKLDEIVDAIKGKEAQTAHHIDRQNKLLEKIITLLEIMTKTKPTPLPLPDRTQEAPSTEIPVVKETQRKPVAPPAPPKSDDVTRVRNSFKGEHIEMLTFEESGDYVVIKTRRFLGSDNFAKIASVVRALGGEYISAGKDSHFKVPKAV